MRDPDKYLNPSLYRSLEAAVKLGLPGGFGGSAVRLAAEGRRFVGKIVTDAVSGARRLETIEGGEQYAVCCPKCGDTRYRLFFSHRWGVWDDEIKAFNYHLLHCFNAQCDKSENFISAMRDTLSPYVQRACMGMVALGKASPESLGPAIIEAPGPCSPLNELPGDHPCRKYLTDRGADVDLVAREFGMQFCYMSRRPFANHRLIAPVFMGGQLRGWQARYIDHRGEGSVDGLFACSRCWHQFVDTETLIWSTAKRAGVAVGPRPKSVCPRCRNADIIPVPKWWTPTGQKKTHWVYNLDAATKWPFVVICEGPLDPVGVGTPEGRCLAGPAVSLFGHSPSAEQERVLFQHFGQKAAVLLFDPDVWASETERPKAEEFLARLKGNYRGGACAVVLPHNRDPMETDHALLWQLILYQAKQEGVRLLQVAT